MGILAGKRILVTGVTATSSIAFHIARIAQDEGAQVVVTSFGRALSVARRAVTRLEPTPPIIELDVTDPGQLAALAGQVEGLLGGLDGVVHSIAFANPETALGGKFLTTEWPDVEVALRVSAYSLVELTRACKPLLAPGASIVSLTFDGAMTWPGYDWMGVAKAALESVSRYVARYLGPAGVRVNAISAGPLDTLAKSAIPDADVLDEVWRQRALLGWDPGDATPTAKAVVALLSDWFPKTTGDIIHVDGGVHSTGPEAIAP
ncbi:MAG: enoyl-ACP reductase FabI [Propionibacteriaceae bacterium]|jgi:enoyl-[acyl-carrier protein] reductase I|nr:enoyl-ACP reductase FabI [Propionibacteriaceae bacterium]